MSNLARPILVILLALACPSANTPGQSQTNTKKSLTGAIAGRVTVSGKGAAGVIVGLRNSYYGGRPGPLIKGKTDQDGNYRITGVPAGSYQVAPVAPAFVTSITSLRATMVVLAEGETVEGIDFALFRGGVITGRVADSDGRPLIDEPVFLFNAELGGQRDQQYPIMQSFQTDDRGIYRMFGLAAGRYKVAVGRVEQNFSGIVGMGRISYGQTFHPDVADASKATVVEVTEGGEATKVDITVGHPVRGFSVSGRVVDGGTGQPVPNMRVGLRHIVDAQRTQTANAMSASNSNGEFRIEDVEPGKYAIYILPQPGNDLRSDEVLFEVTDQDVTGLLINTSIGASIAGIVVLEDTEDKAAINQLRQLRILAFTRSDGPGIVQSSVIGPDGSFRLGGLQSGVANISLAAQYGPPLQGFAILRIEREGVVQPRNLEIKTGEQITDLRIVVAHGTAIIRGIVKIENGVLPAGAQISVRLVRPGQTTQDMNLRPVLVDPRGHFLMEGIPAGNYELSVTAFASGLRSRPPGARQLVTVANGVVNEVTITLDLGSSPDPSPVP